jgi:hypothetical protein
MPTDENSDIATTTAGRKRPGALQLGPRKKPYVTITLFPIIVYLQLTRRSCGTDPLVHHGRHFGRAIHALCTVQALSNNGILRIGELAEQPEDSFTHEYSLIVSVCVGQSVN